MSMVFFFFWRFFSIEQSIKIVHEKVGGSRFCNTFFPPQGMWFKIILIYKFIGPSVLFCVCLQCITPRVEHFPFSCLFRPECTLSCLCFRAHVSPLTSLSPPLPPPESFALSLTSLFSKSFPKPTSPGLLCSLTLPSSAGLYFPCLSFPSPQLKQNNTRSRAGPLTKKRIAGKKTLLTKETSGFRCLWEGLLNHLLVHMWNFQQCDFHVGEEGKKHLGLADGADPRDWRPVTVIQVLSLPLSLCAPTFPFLFSTLPKSPVARTRRAKLCPQLWVTTLQPSCPYVCFPRKYWALGTQVK